MEKLNLRNGFWEKEIYARFGSRSDAKTLAGPAGIGV
jgi:hypothetical protein